MSIQPSTAAPLARRPIRPSRNPRCSRPITLGDLPLNNRLVLSPMTRSRALDGNVANPLAATYYAQRASAGLMITEGTQVSPQGVGYIRTPGIHSPEQVEGWKHVTDAVHRVGGTIFAQLWHVGRVSHPDFHGGALPVAPSALPVEGEAFTDNGKVKIPTPRALETQRDPRHRRAIPQGRRERQGRRLRRRRAARRQRLPARPVPARRLQPPHRRLRRQHLEPRALAARSRRSGGRGLRTQIASATSSRPTSRATRCRTPIRSRPSPTSRRSSASSGSAICTCRKRSPAR